MNKVHLKEIPCTSSGWGLFRQDTIICPMMIIHYLHFMDITLDTNVTLVTIKKLMHAAGSKQLPS